MHDDALTLSALAAASPGACPAEVLAVPVVAHSHPHRGLAVLVQSSAQKQCVQSAPDRDQRGLSDRQPTLFA
jgi:hypothetical protein